MQYTKGKAGPISRMIIDINMVHHFDDGTPKARARGTGIAQLARTRKGVSFLIQGKHHRALRDELQEGSSIDVTVRWTARDEVTIVETHPAQKLAA